MARYIVKFGNIWEIDQVEKFFSIDDAVNYWNFYADFEFITSGELIAIDEGEIIWKF